MESFMKKVDEINSNGDLNKLFLEKYDTSSVHEKTMEMFYEGNWMSLDSDSFTTTFRNSLEYKFKEHFLKEKSKAMNQETVYTPSFSKEQYARNSSAVTADMMRWLITSYDGVYDVDSWTIISDLNQIDQKELKNGTYQIQFSNALGFGHTCTVFFDRYVYQSDLVDGKSGYWTVLSEPIDLSQSVSSIYEKVTKKRYDSYDYKGDGMCLFVPNKSTILKMDDSIINTKHQQKPIVV